MHLFSNTKLMLIFLAVATLLFFALLKYEPQTTTAAPISIPDSPAQTLSYLEQAEQRRAQLQEQKSEEEIHTKLQKQKLESVECKFWTQQKKENSPARVDEKIDEYCNLH